MKTRLFAASAVCFGLLSATLLVAAAQDNGGDKGARVYRASHINGLTVKNHQNENIGHIEDIVVDLQNGKVVYYALGREQVVGFGGKLFAIPPDALKLKADDRNYPQHFLLDVSAKEFENAKGFDTSSWPREPDARWGKGAGKEGEARKEANQADNQEKGGIKGKNNLTRLSALMRMDVRNREGTDLGDVFDMGIDVGNHKIVYVAVSRAGALGVGGKLYAVPFSAMKMDSLNLVPGSRAFVINATEQDFNNAKGFTSNDTWPTTPDAAFKGLQKNNKERD